MVIKIITDKLIKYYSYTNFIHPYNTENRHTHSHTHAQINTHTIGMPNKAKRSFIKRGSHTTRKGKEIHQFNP